MRDLLAFLLPAEASAYSHQVDIFALAFLSLVIALSAPVFILITAFAVKYRRGKEANRVHPPQKSAWMEISWAAIPFLCLLGFFAWATALFATRYAPPADALTIDVVVKQWMWKFQHPEGQGEIDELHVPVGRPVKLVMASQDVIHSLYIPSLRLKQDVVPGRYTTMWFTADRPGVFGLACAEFCGTDHSVMGGKFIALDAAVGRRFSGLCGAGQGRAHPRYRRSGLCRLRARRYRRYVRSCSRSGDARGTSPIAERHHHDAAD